ncbi:MAG: hypothetical protein IKN75_05645 [Prevotella sp.]|nr:hypothetical protein [Prevotella sp.]
MKKTTLRSLAFGLAAMLAIVSRAQTIERNMEELFSIADRNNTSIRSCQTAIEKSQQNVEAARSQHLPDVSTFHTALAITWAMALHATTATSTL